MPCTSYFHQFISDAVTDHDLIVQPRMGFSDHATMREGLERVKLLEATTIGTITLDSFTRTGDFASARKAIKARTDLNGYPIVSYGRIANRKLIDGLIGRDFPIQVRHGCPLPLQIFKSLLAAGIDATEGGPISYCMPYSRVPIKESIQAWRQCCELFAQQADGHLHIESFGGCMMGQLCPPAMLIAITVAEALFFRSFGVRSVSVSLGQGSNLQQDVAALSALRRIGRKYLGTNKDWHIVLYAFMGKFPETPDGAKKIMEDCVTIAKAGGADRLIVKTANEAHQIPTIDDNLEALDQAYQNFRRASGVAHVAFSEIQTIYEEADFLLSLLLNLDQKIGLALEKAFTKGYWDVPFCLHPDNYNTARARLDKDGRILWSNPGHIPFPSEILKNNFYAKKKLTSGELLEMLSYNQTKYDLHYSSTATIKNR